MSEAIEKLLKEQGFGKELNEEFEELRRELEQQERCSRSNERIDCLGRRDYAEQHYILDRPEVNPGRRFSNDAIPKFPSQKSQDQATVLRR